MVASGAPYSTNSRFRSPSTALYGNSATASA